VHKLAKIVSADCTEYYDKEPFIFSLHLEKMPSQDTGNKEEDMGYKKLDEGISFAEVAL